MSNEALASNHPWHPSSASEPTSQQNSTSLRQPERTLSSVADLPAEDHSTTNDGFPVRYLIDAEGRRHHDEMLSPFVEDVDDARLLELYTDMVLIRNLDHEATMLQRKGELGLWPPLLGQEAAQVGSIRALDQHDFAFPSYRENGVAYLRGVAIANLLKVWRGNSHGGWDPYSHVNMATNQVIIGSQALHATGYAMGVRIEGANQAVIAYFGDGATSKGDVHEAMVFASSFHAPVIFFCQNNQWAISEPVGLQAQRPVAGRAPGYGIESMRVDGNDVLAVLAATRWARERAISGEGPSFIEAVTYRMGPHTTADDPSRYRDAEELELWKQRDPLKRIAGYLRDTGALTSEISDHIEVAGTAVAHQTREACAQLSDPGALSIFDQVYAEPHPRLDEQRSDYQRYLDGFADVDAGGQR